MKRKIINVTLITITFLCAGRTFGAVLHLDHTDNVLDASSTVVHLQSNGEAHTALVAHWKSVDHVLVAVATSSGSHDRAAEGSIPSKIQAQRDTEQSVEGTQVGNDYSSHTLHEVALIHNHVDDVWPASG